jgi:DNA primase
MSIVEAIQHLEPSFQPPEDNGRTWVHVLCPFHGDSIKSAAISYKLDAFNCLGCGIKGNPVTLIAKQKGISYSSAKQIAEGLPAGSHQAVPRKPRRKPSSRVFEI